MKIEIDKSLGAHVCFQCKSALKDADFNLCGIRVNADEPGMCFDYICPKCNFNGRWTVALIQAVPSVAASLETLKDALSDQKAFTRTRRPSFRLKGNRLSEDLFNE